jgi:hypothetical protein
MFKCGAEIKITPILFFYVIWARVKTLKCVYIRSIDRKLNGVNIRSHTKRSLAACTIP